MASRYSIMMTLPIPAATSTVSAEETAGDIEARRSLVSL
jgi:hypothetical protein